MLARLRTIFAIPELRQKILITMVLLAVYRMGFNIFLPFIDQVAFTEQFRSLSQQQGGLGQVMQAVALLSASDMGSATIFGLGIMPYISASIIFQLMGQVYPPLEALRKEGETGRKKINEYTRYATVFICLGQSWFWVNMLGGQQLGGSVILDGFDTWYYRLIATLTMTAGTLFLMWVGEQIDEYGVGNGISLLIMAGILAQMPAAGVELLRPALKSGVALGTPAGIDKLLPLVVLFVAVVLGVIAITQAQRRIPIQSAKHVRGRRVHGGQRQFLPLRVNQAGVMPIIFAGSLLMFPAVGISYMRQWATGSEFWGGVFSNLDAMFTGHGLVYNLLYIALIYFFCYFWTSITFNPKDMAENLKDYGSFVPGYRPGSHTEKYLDQVMTRITYVGAAFLALIAIIPTAVATSMNISFMVASFYGGTGLLIVVSVVLDLIQKIDSHLVMRNKAGLLDSAEEA